MPDLAGRGALGLKQPKPHKAPRKPLPKQSTKRKAYLSSGERKAGLAHIAAVAQFPCMVCGAWPVEVHHEGFPRSDMRCLPLCARHHRREFGPGAFHYSPQAFYAAHGASDGLLSRVENLLAQRTKQA